MLSSAGRWTPGLHGALHTQFSKNGKAVSITNSSILPGRPCPSSARAVIMLPATPPPIFKVTPAWDDEEVEHFEFGYWEREERAKKVRAFRIKCDHLRARVWEAVEHGDDNSIFLVIKHVEKDANIESMTDIIDPVTADGVTPVYKACRYGHPECARQLIVAGARPSRSTKTGSLTPLFGAAMGGHPACIELLLKQRDVRLEHRTTDGRTALYAAAEGGNRRCVELLIEAKAEVNTRRKDRSTPLIVASYFGHVEVVVGADAAARAVVGRRRRGRGRGRIGARRVLEAAREVATRGRLQRGAGRAERVERGNFLDRQRRKRVDVGGGYGCSCCAVRLGH